MPPLAPALRQFIAWMAQYTMSPPGQVLRMFLPAKETFEPVSQNMGYSLSGASLSV